MLLDTTTDPRDASTCRITYEEAPGWLRATWTGFVDPVEARRGAEAYLQHAARQPCARLLNDNSRLRGPWFDSLDWLAEIWVPQAARLGLRSVAHVVQADRAGDILSVELTATLPFDLQLFHDLSEAENWLSQQPGLTPPTHP